jgi:hypothetical protein
MPLSKQRQIAHAIVALQSQGLLQMLDTSI